MHTTLSMYFTPKNREFKYLTPSLRTTGTLRERMTWSQPVLTSLINSAFWSKNSLHHLEKVCFFVENDTAKQPMATAPVPTIKAALIV